VRHAGGDDRLGDTVAEAEDPVEAVEPEPLDGRGKERQVVAIVPGHARQVLDERGVDRPTLDDRRDAAGQVDQREQLRIGKALADHLERLLAAAHSGQPVVNEGELHVGGTPA
jgi:hypothetical protein